MLTVKQKAEIENAIVDCGLGRVYEEYAGFACHDSYEWNGNTLTATFTFTPDEDPDFSFSGSSPEVAAYRAAHPHEPGVDGDSGDEDDDEDDEDDDEDDEDDALEVAIIEDEIVELVKEMRQWAKEIGPPFDHDARAANLLKRGADKLDWLLARRS